MQRVTLPGPGSVTAADGIAIGYKELCTLKSFSRQEGQAADDYGDDAEVLYHRVNVSPNSLLRCKCVLQDTEIVSTVNRSQTYRTLRVANHVSTRSALRLRSAEMCSSLSPPDMKRSRCITTGVSEKARPTEVTSSACDFLQRTSSGVLPGLCRILFAAFEEV